MKGRGKEREEVVVTERVVRGMGLGVGFRKQRLEFIRVHVCRYWGGGGVESLS